MISKNFWGNKKSLLFGILLIIFLALSFLIIPAPKAEAWTAPKADTCPFGWFSELECYNDPAGLGGKVGCVSSIECCALCNPYKTTCTITTGAATEFLTEYEYNANGPGSCTEGVAPNQLECRSADATGACPDTSNYNGGVCTVEKINPADANQIWGNAGRWDASDRTCIHCNGASEGNTADSLCGTTAAIYLSAAGACTGTGDGMLESACGASAACNELAVGAACSPPVGGTCNAAGVCVAPNALSLTITASPNPVTVSGTSTVTFTVTNANTGLPESVATVTVNSVSCAGGSLPNPVSTTNAAGLTTSTFTAPAAAGICTVNATASKPLFTNGTATASITVTTCVAPNFADYQDYRYVRGETLALDGFNPTAPCDFSLCIYNPSNNLVTDQSFNLLGPCFPQTLTFASNATGTWKGLAVPGLGACPNPFNAAVGCPASTDVVECDSTNVSNCLSGLCDLSTYTCIVVGPCVPTGPEAGNCSDGIDNDCDGLTDGADPECSGCVPTGPEAGNCSDGIDNDCDGLTDGADPECSGCVPTGPEAGNCSDGIDNDCDGLTDGADPECGGPGTCPPEQPPGGLIPCGRSCDDGSTPYDEREECTLCHFFLMIKNGVDFLMKIGIMIALFLIVISGFTYVFSLGEPQRINRAKTILTWSIGGFIIMLIGWLIVAIILAAFGYIDPLSDEWSFISC